MKRLTLLIAPLMLTACLNDPFSMKPEVKIDPDTVQSSKVASTARFADLQSGERITLRTGDTLELSFKSNATTGYQWTLPALSNNILTLMNSTYESDPAPEGMVGVGGEQVFTFAPTRTGTTKMRTFYQRHPGDVVDEREITIEVMQ